MLSIICELLICEYTQVLDSKCIQVKCSIIRLDGSMLMIMHIRQYFFYFSGRTFDRYAIDYVAMANLESECPLSALLLSECVFVVVYLSCRVCLLCFRRACCEGCAGFYAKGARELPVISQRTCTYVYTAYPPHYYAFSPS